MAINLQAILRLDGNQFTNQIRQVQRQVQTANRAMQSMNSVNTRLGQSLRTSSAASRTMTVSQTQLRNAIQRSQTATTQLRTAQTRLQQQTTAANTATQRLNRTVGQSSTSFGLIGRTAGSAMRALTSMRSTVLGLAGAYLSMQSAKKVFESTIGEAAKYEQSKVIIEAMFQDDKKAEKYMKAMNKLAIDSPLLNSNDIFANSKSFISFSQDLPTLERMFKLVERLNASDPMQGVEGAVFSLKELFSGDALSIQRRFEIGTKSEWNEIKKLSVDKQVTAVEKLLDKYRITEEVIEKMGGTTLGVWNQIKESTEVLLRDMGAPALLKIRDFLNGFKTGLSSVSEVMADRNLFSPEEFRERLNRAMMFERFKETGAKILENISEGFIKATTSIGKWVESITNNPEFQKLDSLQAKVGFVFDDIWARFKEWMDGGGQTKINDLTKNLLETLSTGLIASQQIIVDTAVIIGKAVGSAMISSASESFAQWQNTAMSDSKLFKLPGLAPFKWMNDWGMDLRDKYYNPSESNKTYTPNSSLVPKKNGGLSRVPYNGATYSLHKDEMILNRGEADAYRNGGRGGVTITGNTFNVREESDIQKIAYELARLIEMEGVRLA